MLCDECKKNEAVYHTVSKYNGKKGEIIGGEERRERREKDRLAAYRRKQAEPGVLPVLWHYARRVYGLGLCRLRVLLFGFRC